MIPSPEFAPRFLIVDEDPIAASSIQRSLGALGIESDYVANGKAALRVHRKDPYRVVVASNTLPDTEGRDLCRAFRASSRSPVYFILASAPAEAMDRAASLDAGIDDFLQKPIVREELRSRIQLAKRVVTTEDYAHDQHQESEKSARHTAELNESLRIASRRFEDLFCGLPVACFTFDTTGGIHEWNRAAEESFGVAAFDTIMRPVWEVLTDDDGVWSQERCTRVFSGSGSEEFEWTFNGVYDTREFACRIIALRGRNGRPVGAVCANVDVTAHRRSERLLASEKANLESANARLQDLASKDGLTGLFNRRAFLIDLEEALAAYNSTGKSFSLVLLDIDNFKAYNDSFGHPAGDEVLRRFARVLRSVARSSENPARYGGEEFAIVLHGAAMAKALPAAERFRKAVEDGDWIERAVTCSLGVATVGANGNTVESLIAAADAALYTSKQQGRNRCSSAPSMTEKLAA